ncbi:hypothetical protein [Streptomyces sp. NPDC058694]|uniref:hypothetical protein n=1 Tax=Streptomyces sp. NPDC058694 TaxID=3346603 RepID=UPI00364F0C5B
MTRMSRAVVATRALVIGGSRALVIGGSRPGLAAGHHLRRLGVDVAILGTRPTPGGARQHAS